MKSQIRKYGITEHKQAELNDLSAQVEEAGYEVNELQAVVDALAQKLATFQGFLTDADNGKSTALTNLNLLNAVVEQVKELQDNSRIVAANAQTAEASTDLVAEGLSSLIKDLIFAGEFINKLSQVITKKKALVPLISNELVKVITTATADTNNAVAVTLTALQSCYAAKASNTDAQNIMALELAQTQELLGTITGDTEGFANVTLLKTLFEAILETDARVFELLGATQQAEAACEAASNKVADTATAITQAETDIRTQQAQLQTELESDLTRNVEELERQLASAGRKQQTAKDELDAAAPADKPKHQSVLDAATQKAQQLEKELADAKSKHDEVSTANATVVKTIAETQQHITTLWQQQAAQTGNLEDCTAKQAASFDALEAAASRLTDQVARFDKALAANLRTATGEMKSSLEYLLTQAYQNAVAQYDAQLQASKRVTRELEAASKKLTLAINKLNSLKAGLDAATAAALAA